MTRSKYVGESKLFKLGNHKLSGATLIFNMGIASGCSSRRLGLCEFIKEFGSKSCYATHAELRYPLVMKYRKRQKEYWNSHTAKQIQDEIDLIILKHKGIRYFRYNESGDFYTQSCIDKLNTIAEYLKKKYEIITYGYTARSDLNFDGVQFLVKGSSWKAKDGQTKVIREHVKSKTIQLNKEKFFVCPGTSCGDACRMCMDTKHKNILFIKH